jgi:hypothetical protein
MNKNYLLTDVAQRHIVGVSAMDESKLRLQLESLRAHLLDVHPLLAGAQAQDGTTELRIEIERVIDRLQDVLQHQSRSASAFEAFDRLRPVDRAMDHAMELWRVIRTDTGRAAAEEILRTADTFGGWQKRWGDMAEAAWKRRNQLETAVERESDQPAQALLRGARPRRSRGDLLLELDLRHGAGLPLAQIADMLNISPAAVQIGVRDFEDAVFSGLAREVIERQVPPGWRLVARAASQRDGGLMLRSVSHIAAQSVLNLQLPIIPIWDGSRESSAGRPRSHSPGLTRSSGAGVHQIWVVVFAEGPRVLFVPDVVHEQIPGMVTDADPTFLAIIAQERGLNVLADAVEQEVSHLVTTRGGAA